MVYITQQETAGEVTFLLSSEINYVWLAIMVGIYFFYAICLSVEMCSDSRRCHWDVERLFLSFRFSNIVFLTTVKATIMGCSYFSGFSTEERSPSRQTEGRLKYLRSTVEDILCAIFALNVCKGGRSQEFSVQCVQVLLSVSHICVVYIVWGELCVEFWFEEVAVWSCGSLRRCYCRCASRSCYRWWQRDLFPNLGAVVGDCCLFLLKVCTFLKALELEQWEWLWIFYLLPMLRLCISVL